MDVTVESVDGIKLDDTYPNVLQEDNKTNPLLLSPVIKCIYKYLNLCNIKNCRLASWEWYLNSKLIFRDRSKIILTSQEWGDHTISKFLDFSDSAINIPFDAFQLSYNNGQRWKVCDLNEFFDSQQQNIKVIELDRMYMEDEKQNIIDKYDFTPWISKSLMAKPNTKYNTKLAVYSNYCNSIEKTQLSVSLSALVSIKTILLTHVLVKLDNADGIKMRPIELNLLFVKFCLNDVQSNTIRINDVVDFLKCKSVLLVISDGGTNITLDLGGNEKSVNLDKITLCDSSHARITVVNWTNSTWKVKKLKMIGVPFLEKCGMEIVKLDCFYCNIDLSCLPKSIEIFSLIQGIPETVECSHPLFLPNLKSLFLIFGKTVKFSVLSNFKNCANIVHIYLHGVILCESDRSENIKLNFDWIPKSVRRLKLNGTEIEWEGVGDELLLLDQLVLKNSTFENVKRVCIDNVKAKEIILDFTDNRNRVNYSQSEFIDLIKYFDESSKREAQRIIAGPFKLNEERYLDNFVDKISEYYIFEGQRGRAVDEKFFNGLVPQHEKFMGFCSF